MGWERDCGDITQIGTNDWREGTPSAFGTSPKYDKKKSGCGFKVCFVGFVPFVTLRGCFVRGVCETGLVSFQVKVLFGEGFSFSPVGDIVPEAKRVVDGRGVRINTRSKYLSHKFQRIHDHIEQSFQRTRLVRSGIPRQESKHVKPIVTDNKNHTRRVLTGQPVHNDGLSIVHEGFSTRDVETRSNGGDGFVRYLCGCAPGGGLNGHVHPGVT